MSGLYVYALTGTEIPPFPAGGGDLESIDLGGVFAIAEPMAQAPAISEEALRRQHALVLSIAERADAVLPARFGSLLEPAELRRLVDLRRDLIRGALDLVRGREQMTVRINDEQPSRAAAQTPPAATGTAYLNQRRAAASGVGLPGVEAVQRAVRELVAAERVERGRSFTNVYHLIAAGASDTYRSRLVETTLELVPLGLRVSGPWPAFAFVPELIA